MKLPLRKRRQKSLQLKRPKAKKNSLFQIV